MSNETQHDASRTRQVGIVGPLILIFLGIIFLTNTLGYLGWSIWGDIWKLWPVILILIGIDLILGRRWLHITVPDYEVPRQSGRWIGATILILLGVLFLLGNLGLIGWSVWSTIWRLWPILLIAIGLDRLLGRTLPIGRFLALALVVMLVAASIWSLGTMSPLGPALPGEAISQPLNDATRAEVILRPAIGTLRLTGGAPADKLIEGSVDRSGGERVTSDYSGSGGAVRYLLRAEDVPNFFYWGGRRDLTWDLRLNEQVPVDLTVNTGVGQSTIDLSRLNLTALDINTGIGETTLTLPPKGRFQATIKGGIGQTTVRVPKGLALRLQVRTGIGEFRIPAGMEGRNGAYYTPGWENAADRAEITVNGGIGEIRVLEVLF